MATPESLDGAFDFCRVMYRNQPFGAGGGWSADYPSTDVNLSIRVALRLAWEAKSAARR
jgi:hypothetical protein